MDSIINFNDKVYDYSTAFKTAVLESKEDLPPIKVKFTKDIVKQLFDNRRKNRNISARKIKDYQSQMTLGDIEKGWRAAALYETPVKIDRFGTLVGGQHRCLAFLRSNLTEIIFAVQFNTSETGRRMQDCNGGRKKVEELDMFYTTDNWENISGRKKLGVARMLYHLKYNFGKKYDISKIEVNHAVSALMEFEEGFRKLNSILKDKPKKGELFSMIPYLSSSIFVYKKIPENIWEKMILSWSDPTTTDPYATALYELESIPCRSNPTEMFKKTLIALDAIKKFINNDKCLSSAALHVNYNNIKFFLSIKNQINA